MARKEVLLKYNNKPERKEHLKRYYELNKQQLLDYKKEHYKRNKSRYVSNARKRELALLERTPKWLTQEQLEQIHLLFKNKPPGFHIDHIVPLQGLNVSGLHVPWNLQYLPAKENRSKSNKF